MKIRLLIIIGIASIAGFATYTSGAFTPLQSDLSECHYTDDENDIPQPCMVIDGWYDMLLQQSLQTKQDHCGEKHMMAGNDECVLNLELIEPFTVIIYDVVGNGGTRLSIAPHNMVMDLRDGNTVTFVNDGSNTVNIVDNSKGLWSFDSVKPSSQRELAINGTGFYEFLVQSYRDGEGGGMVALSEDTNSLPVETRAKMAQAIVSSDLRKEVELISVGSGGAEPGITIGIDEKFRDKNDDAERFYYEKYKEMIPFDVPIWIEFTTPITFARG